MHDVSYDSDMRIGYVAFSDRSNHWHNFKGTRNCGDSISPFSE